MSLSYTLTYKRIGNSYTVTGIQFDEDRDTTVEIPNTYNDLPVTAIKDHAFEGTKVEHIHLMTSVSIGNNVTSIGNGAFFGCGRLASVTIGNSVTSIGDYAFQNCIKLEEIVIPDSVTSIGDYAFQGCSGLKNATIGNSVVSMSIGSHAFDGCSILEFVIIRDGVTSIGSQAFISCGTLDRIIIPDSVTSIGHAAFENCFSLKLVKIGNGVTSIGSYAFNTCYNLADVAIGNSVEEIGESAFWACHKLTSIVIPNSVTSIGNNAFAKCKKLMLVTIGNSVEEIGRRAFEECDSLTQLIMSGSRPNIYTSTFPSPETLSKIIVQTDYYEDYKGANIWKEYNITAPTLKYEYKSSDNVYYVIGYEGNIDDVGILAEYDGIPVTGIDAFAFENCSSLESITIPSSITSIGSNAFSGCSKLKTVNISSGSKMTTIGFRAFYNCSSLESITIPSSVTSIERYAFYNNSRLTSIEIPNSVTSIGSSAFSGCSSLESITLPFVGAKAGVTSSSTYQYPLGYIFGASQYDNSAEITQEYYDYTGSTTSYTYYIPSDLTTVTITGGHVPYGAFWNCRMIRTIKIDNNVTSIADHAFHGCIGLADLTLPFVGDRADITSNTIQYPLGYIFGTSSHDSIPTATMQYYHDSQTGNVAANYYIPTSLKSITITGRYIPFGAFLNCSMIEDIDTGNSVTSIGEGAFANCNGLKRVTIGNKVTSIGGNAFIYCNNLSKVNYTGSINSWVQISFDDYYANPLYRTHNLYINDISVTKANITATNISAYAFYGCSSLTSVTISNSVTSIGGSAFYGCDNLSKVNYTGNINSWAQITFDSSDANPLYRTHNLYINDISVTEVNITTATKISAYAFYNCSSLTSVTIGNSVTSIGDAAFSGCSGLTEITLPFVGNRASVTSNSTYQYPLGYIFGTLPYTDGTKVTQSYHGSSTSSTTSNDFYIPTLLRSITIRGGGHIPYGAFWNCSMINNIIIGSDVTSIDNHAFHGCSGLTDLTLPFVGKSGDARYPQYPLGYIFGNSPYEDSRGTEVRQTYKPSSTGSTTSSTYYIPSDLTTVTITGKSDGYIPYGAFSKCSMIKDITIGSKITSIGGSAFYDCSGLTDITIGNKVTSIGSSAFYGCNGLTSITIPDSVTEIGSDAFHGCSSLTDVTIGESVVEIGGSAFYGCNGLTSITIPDSVTEIGSDAFYGCGGLSSVKIGDSVVEIGGSAFYGCDNLSKVNYTGNINSWAQITFDSSDANPLYRTHNLYINDISVTEVNITTATKISAYAFYNCSSLTSVTIGNSVTEIGSDAFYGCSSLTDVTIGESVVEIGGSAFYGCNGLTSITIPDSVTSIGVTAFYTCYNLTNVTIGNSVEEIGESAFLNCNRLNRVNYIGDIDSWVQITFGDYYANPLYYAHKLYINDSEQKYITITTDTIKQFAFVNTTLEEVVLSSTVSTINTGAFYSNKPDYVLDYVQIDKETPPNLVGNSVTLAGNVIVDIFDKNADYPFFVPENSIEAYTNSSSWRDYSERIRPTPQLILTDNRLNTIHINGKECFHVFLKGTPIWDKK